MSLFDNFGAYIHDIYYYFCQKKIMSLFMGEWFILTELNGFHFCDMQLVCEIPPDYVWHPIWHSQYGDQCSAQYGAHYGDQYGAMATTL